MNQLIIAAWALSIFLIFLPVETATRLIGRWLRPYARSPEPPDLDAVPSEGLLAREASSTGAAPHDYTAGGQEPPALRKRALGLFGLLWTWSLYLYFIGASVYLGPILLAGVLNNEHPLAAITSQSMYPVLKRGDLVLLEGVGTAADLRVGDILAFEDEDGFAIHRIVNISGETITTKGDANQIQDEPITFDRVVGRVLTIRGRLAKVPYIGNIPLVLKNTNELEDGQVQESDLPPADTS